MDLSPIIHLNIPSRELNESAAIYGDVFGWEFTPNTDEYLLFNDGGHGGGFYAVFEDPHGNLLGIATPHW